MSARVMHRDDADPAAAWSLLCCDVLPSAGRYGIMLACWQGEPTERPMFPSLVQILGDLLQDNSLPVRCSLKKNKKQMRMFKKKNSAPLSNQPLSGREGLRPAEPVSELRG